MVELSTFIGQIISDVANARKQADTYAASVSELYHADPFVKNLPVPHYTIESAEIDVPVMVVGIAKSSDEFAGQLERLFAAIKEKLPVMLMRNYKFSYIRARETEKEKEAEQSSSREKLRREKTGDAESGKRRNLFAEYEAQFTPELLEEFENSARSVTAKVLEAITSYLDTYNYDLVKILDLTDEFIRYLKREIRRDVSGYQRENCPYLDDAAISSAAQYIGNLMFFEFKKIMRSSAAVQIDANTVQMNEYATRDCLMHIKLKVREQDLSLMVEEDEKGRERRFLSLS